MKNQLWYAGNIIAHTVVACILVALQCSFWFQVFGQLPPPQIWIPILVFWYIYRGLSEAIIMAYVMSLLLSAFTVMPFGQLLLVAIVLLLLVRALRARIYWAGVTYFVLISAVVATSTPLIFLVTSWLTRSPSTHIHLLDWTLSLLLTTALSLYMFRLLNSLDRLTQWSPDFNLGEAEI